MLSTVSEDDDDDESDTWRSRRTLAKRFVGFSDVKPAVGATPPVHKTRVDIKILFVRTMITNDVAR